MKGLKIMKKALSVFLCVLMVFFTVSAAAETTWNWRDETNTSGTSPDKHTHVYGEWVVTKDPTCISKGERQRTCIYAKTDSDGNTQTCGYVYTEEMAIEPDAHIEGTVVTTKEPTCKSVGISTFTCNGCQESTTVYINTLEHTFDESLWYVLEPIHDYVGTTAGLKRNSCTVCGTTVEITIPVEHDFKEGGSVTKAPTCTTKGTMLRYCTTCKASKTVVLDIDENNHVYSGKALAIGEVSCETGGKGIVNCEACGETVYVDIPASEAHDYIEWEYTAATGDCLDGTNGRIEKTCKTCGKSFETKYWSGHVLGDDARTHAATCSDYGYTKGTCTLCQRTDAEVVIAPVEDAHSWVEEVLIEPTCTTQGYVFRMCKYDSSHVKYSNIDANGHTYNTEWTVVEEAKCYKTGKKTNTCTVCNELVPEIIPIDPDNHTIAESEWKVDKYASCTEVGIEKAACEYCTFDDIEGYVTREIPKHTGYLVEISRTEATCCLEGKITYDCTNCSADVYETIPVDPYAHKIGSAYYVVKNTTCYEEGILSKLCDYCMTPVTDGTEENAQKPIEKKSHIVGAWTVTKTASCTENGLKVRYCTVEGCNYSEELTIPASHRYESWVIIEEATCTTTGTRERGCYNCSETFTETYTGDHEPNGWEFIGSGSCEKGGTAVRTCKNCDNQIEITPVKAGEHVNLTAGKIEYAVSDSICSRQAYECQACEETVYTYSSHTLTSYKNIASYSPLHDKCYDEKCTKEHEVLDGVNYHIICTDEDCEFYHEPIKATCENNGWKEKYYCMVCKRTTKQEFIDATGHNFEYDEEGTKYCLNCTLYYVEGGTSETCDHFCHNNGTIAKIMTKFFTFFWKILDRFSPVPKYQYCECGLPHYETEIETE